MTAPIIYRSDDPNAPVLSAAATALGAVLQACLCDGYGSGQDAKPAAGWTLEFSDAATTKYAFRNNPATGTGFYFKCEPSTTTTSGGVSYTTIHKFTGYEGMGGIDSGVNAFGGTSNQTLSVSNANSTQSRPWLLLADDRFFWLFVWYTQTTMPSAPVAGPLAYMIGVGDAVPFYADDTYFSGVWGVNSGYGIQTAATSTATGSYFVVARNRLGALKATQPVAHTPPPCPIYSGASDIAREVGAEIFVRPPINDSTVYSFRGYLPGWHHTNAASRYFSNLERLAGPNGQDFLLVASWNNLTNSTNNFAAAIDVSDHWRETIC